MFICIPLEVLHDKGLKDKAKLLYGEIASLSVKNGYCYASNSYFADKFNVTPTTISILINDLVKKGYLESEIVYKENSKEIKGRYLKNLKYPIKEKLNTYIRNLKYPIKEILKENNINNNKEIENKYINDNVIDYEQFYANIKEDVN